MALGFISDSIGRSSTALRYVLQVQTIFIASEYDLPTVPNTLKSLWNGWIVTIRHQKFIDCEMSMNTIHSLV